MSTSLASQKRNCNLADLLELHGLLSTLTSADDAVDRNQAVRLPTMKPAVSLLCIGLLYAAAPALGGRPFGRRQPEAAVPSKPSLGEQTRPFHARPAAECLSALGANPRTGLDAAAVEAARAEHGPNELAAAKATPLWRLFLAQFDDSLVKILLVTAAVSMSLALIEREEHGWVEPVVILSILALNAVVGVWQQRSAQGAVEALKRLTPVRARCLRDGMWVDDLPAKDLVPGDVVECRTGDRVPADCRVLELRTTTMRTDEASLTGESSTVDKSAQPAPADAALSQRGCILHASTMVASGAALALVLRTGMRTEIGQIQRGVEEAGQEEADTPLARKLDAFGRQLTWMIGGICVAVYALSIPRFASEAHGGVAWRGALHHFKRSVALGVAAIPEGLPAVITLCLSLGTRRMAQRRAIVRKLPSVETLGCTTVICTDKTGTLTTGQMTVVRLVRPSASKDGTPLLFHEVSGRSYATTDGSVEGLSTGDAACRGVRELAECAALSNDADLQDAAAKAAAAAGGGAAGAAAAAAAAAAAESEPVCATGEPTEAALLTLVGKLGRQMLGGRLVDPADSGAAAIPSDPRAELRKLATLEFTRARKSKSALVREVGSRGASARLLVKGAPDSVLSRCSYIRLPDGGSAKLDAAAREAITAAYSAMGKSALRCIAMASKPARALGALASHDGSPTHRAARSLQDPSKFGEVESGLTFLGLVGIRDPPRPSVGGAIAACRAAGIRVIMITGDSKETAQAVAKDVGIFAPGDPLEAWTFTGKSFFNLPEGQQAALLRSGNLVFCRAEPADKQRLVRMLNKLGEVTAMTGDGVNDAPALRQAAIGIAMGIAGARASPARPNLSGAADMRFSSAACCDGTGLSSRVMPPRCLADTTAGLPPALAPSLLRHRSFKGGRRHSARRRQLCHDRLGRRGGALDLRQHEGAPCRRTPSPTPSTLLCCLRHAATALPCCACTLACRHVPLGLPSCAGLCSLARDCAHSATASHAFARWSALLLLFPSPHASSRGRLLPNRQRHSSTTSSRATSARWWPSSSRRCSACRTSSRPCNSSGSIWSLTARPPRRSALTPLRKG